MGENSTDGRVPLKCQWEITCRCNLKCLMCYTDCFNYPEAIRKELSTEEVLKIMNEMRAAGVLELVLTGGEPMARPDFKEIYRHAVQGGFLTTVFTNGTLIDAGWVEFFSELRPERIEVSMHGACETTFEAVTLQKGSYQKVQKAVELLVQAGLPVVIKTTGLPLNASEVPAIKKWAQSLPGVQFRFGRYIRKAADGTEGPLQYQLQSEILADLLASDPDFASALEDEGHLEAAGAFRCHSGRRMFHIDARGMLQLCSNNRQGNYDLRNGSFMEGFYRYLPDFPCPNKAEQTSKAFLIKQEIPHA